MTPEKTDLRGNLACKESCVEGTGFDNAVRETDLRVDGPIIAKLRFDSN
jgi:hypothetical protein